MMKGFLRLRSYCAPEQSGEFPNIEADDGTRHTALPSFRRSVMVDDKERMENFCFVRDTPHNRCTNLLTRKVAEVAEFDLESMGWVALDAESFRELVLAEAAVNEAEISDLEDVLALAAADQESLVGNEHFPHDLLIAVAGCDDKRLSVKARRKAAKRLETMRKGAQNQPPAGAVSGQQASNQTSPQATEGDGGGDTAQTGSAE